MPVLLRIAFRNLLEHKAKSLIIGVLLALGVVILFGRYPPIIFMMAVAGSVAAKPTLAATVGTLRTDTVKFGGFWLGTILVVGALTFLPALVLGPIAEFFAMKGSLAF